MQFAIIGKAHDEAAINAIVVEKTTQMMSRQADAAPVPAAQPDPAGTALIPGKVSIGRQGDVEYQLLHLSLCPLFSLGRQTCVLCQIQQFAHGHRNHGVVTATGTLEIRQHDLPALEHTTLLLYPLGHQ